MNTSTDRILATHVAGYGAIAITIVLASLARVLASSGTAKAVPYERVPNVTDLTTTS